MNEVTVLSTAGELAGRAVGHGVLLARRSVVATTRAAGTLGVVAGRAASGAAAEVVRARRRAAAVPLPELSTARLSTSRLPAVRLPEVRLPEVRLPEVRLPSPDGVRRDLAAAIAPSRRRRWPWVVGVLGVLGAAAVVAVLRRPVAAPPAPAPPRVEDVPAEAGTTTDPGITDPAR